MTVVAAIDCGTNSIRLLIAELHRSESSEAEPRSNFLDSDPQKPESPPVKQVTARLRDIVRHTRIVRLGYGVDRTGEFNSEALAKTLEAVRDYSALIRAHECSKIRFVATSATRDARNREHFISGVQDLLGVSPEVISGDEEARLSFSGATRGTALHTPSPYLVTDLGGGSTELVAGLREPQETFSMDIGSVRLTERYQSFTDPVARNAAIIANIDEALTSAEERVTLKTTGTLIGVAGTITTVTAHALGLSSYDRDAINGARLHPSTLLEACNDLATMPREKLATLPYLHPGRADIIGVGATIWARIILRVQERVTQSGRPFPDVMTSEHDILDGIALSLL
ncbi:exopolyphosphatase [Lysinibacter sp. HNR]|uniref:Ppx/GppA phosphatase family protein n=1 Tax=Lysinibacter sp. HNR TaxID=3031408 RepID=UPI0024348B2E|nr:exopolyphosphatase [Lysinibacter sp. HNR]WGD36764.1 exopolyphosphatase [Lysinibacter sp. HNR]